MQVIDDRKRMNILEAAARLFATQPFHKVLLSRVAEEAGVGKGTLYVYFKNKEDLYLSVLFQGFSRVVDRIRDYTEQQDFEPVETMAMVIREIVGFAYQNPHLFEVMRSVPCWDSQLRKTWMAKRAQMKELILSVILKGIRTGVFEDSHPELTMRYIPGLVRSALMDGTEAMDRELVCDHITRFVRAALTRKEAKSDN